MKDKNAKMIVENYDKVLTITNNDLDLTINEWCHMFYTAMIGITFNPTQVINGMKDFIEDQETSNEVFNKKE